ncbi:hypothetical protein B0T13DRAFT_182633 [Neurospora crassa]|nr:hypothetical protein B0T13DRAFT_182633 [Neurospora crassa]
MQARTFHPFWSRLKGSIFDGITLLACIRSFGGVHILSRFRNAQGPSGGDRPKLEFGLCPWERRSQQHRCVQKYTTYLLASLCLDSVFTVISALCPFAHDESLGDSGLEHSSSVEEGLRGHHHAGSMHPGLILQRDVIYLESIHLQGGPYPSRPDNERGSPEASLPPMMAKARERRERFKDFLNRRLRCGGRKQRVVSGRLCIAKSHLSFWDQDSITAGSRH